jgi:hypothetical protein
MTRDIQVRMEGYVWVLTRIGKVNKACNTGAIHGSELGLFCTIDYRWNLNSGNIRINYIDFVNPKIEQV